MHASKPKEMLNSVKGELEGKEEKMPRKKTTRKTTKKKKWGKVGAPNSKKRKEWMAKIRKKRKKGVGKYTPKYKVKKKPKR